MLGEGKLDEEKLVERKKLKRREEAQEKGREVIAEKFETKKNTGRKKEENFEELRRASKN